MPISTPALLALSSAQVEFNETAARYHTKINAPTTTHIETTERIYTSQSKDQIVMKQRLPHS